MYIETSSPRVQGDTALLQHTTSVPQGSTIKFKYHMYGASTGSLVLEAASTQNAPAGSWRQLWAKSGNQGNSWLSASASVECGSSSCYVRLKGARGNDFTGDIAVDNLEVQWATNSPCSWQHKPGYVVHGSNIAFYTDKSLEECKSICAARPALRALHRGRAVRARRENRG